MFKTMLQTMEQQALASLESRESAQALWSREWAREMLRAFDPEQTVVYTSAYAVPMELLRAFDVAPFDFELSAAMIGTTPLMASMLENIMERSRNI